ncbi:MAG: PAS domain S-box protein, partial [Abitibacteriaceae bacterium]|nr:PAS domain S-box protein [Abditibacteriaceae bacterium]
ILQVITEGMGWDYGAFWLVDSAAQKLNCFKSWHGSDANLNSLDEINQSMSFALDEGYLGQVWAGGRPLWIADLQQEDNFLRKALVEQGVLRSSLAFPIRFGGEILGVMEFFSRQAQQYHPGMLNTLEGLGSQIGQFMERKHAQEALRESEARKSAILESSLDAILTMDHEGKVIEWNPAAESMFGYSRAKAIGCAMVELIFAPSDENIHLDALKRYLATGEGPFTDQHYEFVAVHVDGSKFPVELGISRIHLDDKPMFTAYIRDITRRQLDERALQQAKEEAEHALIEAERANRAKSEFLSRMSHELRTPMNSILGFGQLLKMEQLAPKQNQKVDYILKAGQHLLELINEVLDIARVESGRISLSVEPVRICDLIHDTVSLLEPLAGRRQISLDTQQGMSCNRSVLVDRQRCHQVLLNLLSNAIKYNREGGQVMVACEEDNNHHLKVTVSDTGEGIHAEDLERVFQPFERLAAEATNIEGSGLGLALSKNFVEAMKGTIGVESVVGQGSTFWVALPLAQDQMVHHEQSGGRDLAIAAADASAGNVGTVLYIEDNLANLLVVESILSYQPGIRLITAMQGGLGLELAREHHPTLILLDLHLPDTTGDEVLRRLKAEAGLRDIPVVVLSADATPGQIEDLKAAGARHYLTKPLDVQRFLEVINETL